MVQFLGRSKQIFTQSRQEQRFHSSEPVSLSQCSRWMGDWKAIVLQRSINTQLVGSSTAETSALAIAHFLQNLKRSCESFFFFLIALKYCLLLKLSKFLFFPEFWQLSLQQEMLSCRSNSYTINVTNISKTFNSLSS